MAAYEQWNALIVDHTISRAVAGAPVFLTIDDQLLDVLGKSHPTAEAPFAEHFCMAVRRQVVAVDERVALESVEGRDSDGRPLGVAFLGLMVLAAMRMASDAEREVSELNYFLHFRELLCLAEEPGRPLMSSSGDEGPGAEEVLWRNWHLWLNENGFLASARQGDGGQKYLNYPISQTLLREADRVRLAEKVFPKIGQLAVPDALSLCSRVSVKEMKLGRHLSTVLRDTRRRDAAGDVILDLYLDWCEEVGAASASGMAAVNAGVYRDEDPFTGAVSYRLLPMRRQSVVRDGVRATVNGQEVLLSPITNRWYAPVGELNKDDITNGARFEPAQSDGATISLPRRNHWILVPFPDDPESGGLGSWGRPLAGEQFQLLVRDSLRKAVERLRSERVLMWAGEPAQPWEGWLEYQACQVVSNSWQGLTLPQARDLRDALKPRKELPISLGLNGGMQVPIEGSGPRVWLKDHGPEITPWGYVPQVNLSIIDVALDKVIWATPCPTNSPVAWPVTGTGLFRVEAQPVGDANALEMARLVRLVPWDGLRRCPANEQITSPWGDGRLCGATWQAKGPEE